MTTLTTERLILTPRSVDDFEAQYTVHQDPAFLQHLTNGTPMDGETVWLRLLRDIGHWQVYGYGQWSVRRKGDDQMIGSAGLFEARRELRPAFDAPEVGWAFAPQFQGQGFAHEAVRAVLDHADHVLKLPRTVCMISHGNAASIRLARRVGFTGWCEGRLRDEPILLFERVIDAA